MASQRREEKLVERLERERYWVHVLLYDHPGKKSFRAFLGYYRWSIIQIGWVAWSSFWAGHALADGFTFTFWLNGLLTPFIVLITLFTWHTRVVVMSKINIHNLQEIGRWMRRNGFDQDEPPSWLH